jgi:LL-diaminopimelate aminotransferase
LFAGGENYLLNLLPENNFLPDLKAVPEAICQRAKILWLNYPSNPCAVDASEDFYREAIEFCKRWGIILVSDECYTEIYFDTAKRPHSILEFCQATDPVVSIFSLSKRSNMTGYRVGWVAGNTEIIAAFKKVKTNIDSGTPTFIQKAAIAALNDEEHVEAMRNLYNQKREILIPALKAAGFPDADLEATFYLWQPIPSGFKDSVELAKRLLAPEIGVIVTPGQWISDTFEGVNPGQKFVRFALVPSVEETKRAAERIAKSLK